MDTKEQESGSGGNCGAKPETIPVAEVAIEELVMACGRSAAWTPTGMMLAERFMLQGYHHDWALAFNLSNGDEGIGDHVSDVPSLNLMVLGDVHAKAAMTWGEATELANAMALIIDKAARDAGLLASAIVAEPQAAFRVSGTSVGELIEFCAGSGSWTRAGVLRDGRFTLSSRRGNYEVAFSGGHADLHSGDPVSTVRPLLLSLGPARVPMTIGEAVELLNAMMLIVAVAMFA